MCHHRGALLLEVVLALAIFVAAGMAILTMVGQGVGALEQRREMHRAADLARSALARLEAGIDDVVTLAGPVRPWRESESAVEFDNEPPRENGWRLEIDTSPSPFAGLTLVTVTALREREGGGGVSYSLRQLVRLSAREVDEIGDEDEMSRLLGKK